MHRISNFCSSPAGEVPALESDCSHCVNSDLLSLRWWSPFILIGLRCAQTASLCFSISYTWCCHCCLHLPSATTAPYLLDSDTYTSDFKRHSKHCRYSYYILLLCLPSSVLPLPFSSPCLYWQVRLLMLLSKFLFPQEVNIGSRADRKSFPVAMSVLMDYTSSHTQPSTLLHQHCALLNANQIQLHVRPFRGRHCSGKNATWYQ